MAENKNNAHSTRTDVPNQPVSTFLQEAENLYLWCIDDALKLKLVGITSEMIEDLPPRAEACRRAQAIWNNNRRTINEAEKQWKLLVPQAVELRTELLRAMRYAFRKEPNLQGPLSAISKGKGFADLIQDLNDIAILGGDNKELLTNIGFELSLLNIAATKSEELSEIWAKTKAKKENPTKFKQNRNRTFWHLNELVNEIRAAGKYVFRNDKNRFNGYTSNFWKLKNNKRTKEKSQ